jgi:hypothetical protein
MHHISEIIDNIPFNVLKPDSKIKYYANRMLSYVGAEKAHFLC